MLSPVDRRLAEAATLRRKSSRATLTGLGLGLLAFFSLIVLFSAGQSNAAVIVAFFLGVPAVVAFAYGNSQGCQAKLQEIRAAELAEAEELAEAKEQGRERSRRRD